MRRVNETLKKVISEGIGELKDPGIGFVTVTVFLLYFVNVPSTVE